jgi:hypothetical protein
VYSLDRHIGLTYVRDTKSVNLVEYDGRYAVRKALQEFHSLVPGKYELQYIYDSSRFNANGMKGTVWKDVVSTYRTPFQIAVIAPN